MPSAAVATDIEIYYEQFGDAEDPTLLLVAGLGAQLLMWHEELCWSFVDRGFHVVRFDNRDSGLSSRPAEGSEASNYDLSDMAGDAVGLLDALEVDRAHVLGMSLGAMIAQTMAIDHRERLHTLTSVSSMTGNRDHGWPTAEIIEILSRPAADDPELAIDLAVADRRLWASPQWFDEGAIRDYYRAQDARAPAAASSRQMAAIVASGDREPALRSLDLPTLVIHGDADAMVPPSGGMRTAEVIPGAELLVIEGMGHDLPVQIWPQVIERVTVLAVRALGS